MKNYSTLWVKDFVEVCKLLGSSFILFAFVLVYVGFVSELAKPTYFFDLNFDHKKLNCYGTLPTFLIIRNQTVTVWNKTISYVSSVLFTT